jgi:hypothetical protein
MRKQSERLKNEAYVSVLGGNIIHKLVSDEDFAFVRLNQTCYEPQECGFPATARAEQGEVLFFINH